VVVSLQFHALAAWTRWPLGIPSTRGAFAGAPVGGSFTVGVFMAMLALATVPRREKGRHHRAGRGHGQNGASMNAVADAWTLSRKVRLGRRVPRPVQEELEA
jgi:hypothetical protein